VADDVSDYGCVVYAATHEQQVCRRGVVFVEAAANHALQLGSIRIQRDVGEVEDAGSIVGV
jgi:hypothetical protein